MAYRFPLMIVLLAVLALGTAAEEALQPVSAGNIHNFAPVATVRFEDMIPFMNDETVLPLSGWFALSHDGRFDVFVVDGGIRIGQLSAYAAPIGWQKAGATIIDARFADTDGRLAVVYEREGGYALWVSTADDLFEMPVPAELGVPVRVWLDAEADNAVWIETTPAPDNPDRSGFQVARLDLDHPDAEPLTLPTGPEHDFDSFVRIGRIPAPLAITATFDGTVKRWDLQTGEVTAEVALPVAPTFGRVNETNGVHFAWRDEMSTALHLLNFETGEDREIAPLDGEYIQALIPSPDASVILAVHRGDAPTVTVWIVETGEEIALGNYDTTICSRVPDMVQLSRDGTRLVIGCDAGFQVWQVSSGMG